MHYLARLTTAVLAAASTLVAAPAVLAHAADGEGADRAVFVQTNDPTAGNSIVAYQRAANGDLTFSHTYATGGLGGRALGAAVDPLASQGGLAYDRAHHLLLAVNAGSNSVSVFSVDGAALHLNQVISSGGYFPDSIAIRGNLAYVLDAGFNGAVQGYRIAGGRLHPIRDSGRSLNLANANPPFFLSSPAQIGFTPEGRALVVTTKNHGLVEVFGISANGRPSDAATVTAVGGVPFAIVFDPAGRLALVNAATDSVSTYIVNRDASLGLVSAGPSDRQAAACWITVAGGHYVVANAGSGSLSEYAIDSAGRVTLTAATAATGFAGAIDSAATADERFLYAQSGGSASIDGFAVEPDGSLEPIAGVTGLHVPDGQNMEGIVAA